MFKKLLFFLPLLTVCSLLFTQAKEAFAWEKCFVGTKQVAYMDAGSLYPPFNFLVSGEKATVSFYDFASDVRSGDIYAKLGNSGWIKPTRKEGMFFITDFNVGNENCGNYWATVMWRSQKTGKYQYCNQLISKYTRGPKVADFLNASCLSANCLYSVDPKARQAYVSGEVSFPETSLEACRANKFVLNDKVSEFNYSANGRCVFNGFFAPTLSGGVTKVRVTPLINPLSTVRGSLELFDYISDRYCGGNL